MRLTTARGTPLELLLSDTAPINATANHQFLLYLLMARESSTKLEARLGLSSICTALGSLSESSLQSRENSQSTFFSPYSQ